MRVTSAEADTETAANGDRQVAAASGGVACAAQSNAQHGERAAKLVHRAVLAGMLSQDLGGELPRRSHMAVHLDVMQALVQQGLTQYLKCQQVWKVPQHAGMLALLLNAAS